MLAFTNVPDGDQGIAQILATLQRVVTYYGSLPVIRAAALTITAPQTDNEQLNQITALADYVMGNLVYVLDPINAEYIQTPEVLLLAIAQNGKAYGDCDDHVCLFCSLAQSLGIEATPAAVKTNGSDSLNHVIAQVTMETGEVLDVDLCAKGIPTPVYTERLLPEGN